MALRTSETDGRNETDDLSQAHYDEKFNNIKKDLSQQENSAIPHEAISGYDRKNDGLDKHPINVGTANGRSGDIGQNIGDAQNAESNPNNINYTGSGKQKESLKVWTRKKKTSAVLIMTLLFGGGGFFAISGTLTTALAPVAFIRNVSSDLNDQLSAMDKGDTTLLRNKLPVAERGKIIKGCTSLSIRCRFATISKTQAEKLNSKSIEVKYTETVLGRIVPDSYKFQGQDYTPEKFADALKTDKALNTAYRSANNMKFLGANDATFLGRTLKALGVSKKAPELKGTAEERVNALMNKAGTGNIKDLSFKQVTDSKGNTVYELVGDTASPATQYTEAQVNDMKKAITTRIAAAEPPSQIKSGFIKGLSIIGYADLACSVKNMIGAAAVASKVSHYYQYIQYIMPVLSLGDKLVAGDISPEDGQALGTFMAGTDERKQIVDVQNSVTTDSSGNVAPTTGTVPMIDNPNYGKSAMDSPLYQLSTSGKLGGMSSSESQYSLGMGQNSLLAGFSNVASIANAIGNVAGCKFVQNWAVRGIGLIAGIAVGIASGGSSLAVTAGISGGLILASMTLEAILHGALSNSAIPSNIAQAPVERGAIAWTAISALQGESAKNRGLMPADKSQIVAYNTSQNESKNTYLAVDKTSSGPFDIYNQASFLGSLTQSMLPYMSSSRDVASTIGNIAAFTGRSLGIALNMNTAYAAPVDQSRFTQCDDNSYKLAGIDADVQCNVRYIMPASDMAMNADDVATYMENNNYVAQNTTTGLPDGYTPPQPEASQGFAMDTLNGVKNTFYNDRNYVNDYGKFLDFCVYRALPFGETYAESGQINGVDDSWQNGSKCRDTTDPMMSNFRMYTLLKSVSEARDRDTIDIGTTPSPTPTSPGGDGQATGTLGWPVKAALSVQHMTRCYIPGTFKTGHLGIDIGTPEGSEVDAADGGTVVWTVRDTDPLGAGNYGNAISIQHSSGLFTTYIHNSQLLVKVGDKVTKGQKIALSGNTGNSEGPHLHFEIGRQASPYYPDTTNTIDPLTLLKIPTGVSYPNSAGCHG